MRPFPVAACLLAALSLARPRVLLGQSCTGSDVDQVQSLCREVQETWRCSITRSGGPALPEDRVAVCRQKARDCDARSAAIKSACEREFAAALAELRKPKDSEQYKAADSRLRAMSDMLFAKNPVLGSSFDDGVKIPLAMVFNTNEYVHARDDGKASLPDGGAVPGDKKAPGKVVSPPEKPGPEDVSAGGGAVDPLTGEPIGGPGSLDLPPSRKFEKAREMIKSGRPDEAVGYLDESIRRNPRDPDALAMRAVARLGQGDGGAALEDARAALELDPGNDAAAQLKAYLESGGRVRGVKVQFKAPDFGGGGLGAGEGSGIPAGPPAGGEWMWTAGKPRHAGPSGGAAPRAASPAQALLQSAMAKFRVNDYEGALLDATRALQADKADVRARVIRAAVSNRLKDHEAAAAEATEALKLDPRSVPALLERGFARYSLNDYGAALADVEEALRLEPDNALARLYRAMVLEKLGRRDEALADYEKAARLDPSLKPFWERAKASGAGPESRWRGIVSVRNAWSWGLPAALALLLAIAVLWLRSSLIVPAPAPFPTGKRKAPAPQTAPVGMPPPAEDAGASANGAASAPRAGGAVADAGAAADGAGAAPQAAGGSAGGEAGPGSLVGGGAYRIEREIARGGMGVVYEALDVKLQRRVALKRMNQEACGSPEMRERFLKEARLAARLRHPNLAEIFAVVGEEDVYLVFELVEGETLDKAIARKGRLTLEEAKRVVGEVCGALEHAHNERVIHRDLKPSNVMLDRNGRAKVMDLGIAHDVRGSSSLTQTAAWGTPPYMAPEQEGGRVGRESDLYALAVMAYEMLTGCRPFPGPFFLEKKLKKEYPPATSLNGRLPKTVDAFFATALEPEPEKRLHSAAEFAGAFQAL